MIVRERGSGSREALERALEGVRARADAAFRVVGEMGSTQAIKQAVRAGVGVSLISRRAVDDECRAGLLACVGLTDLRDHARLLPGDPPRPQPLAARPGLPRPSSNPSRSQRAVVTP